MKKILDACCGSRMFWFDRENQDVVFADNRELETTLCDGRNLLIKPDVKMDFRMKITHSKLLFLIHRISRMPEQVHGWQRNTVFLRKTGNHI